MYDEKGFFLVTMNLQQCVRLGVTQHCIGSTMIKKKRLSAYYLELQVQTSQYSPVSSETHCTLTFLQITEKQEHLPRRALACREALVLTNFLLRRVVEKLPKINIHDQVYVYTLVLDLRIFGRNYNPGARDVTCVTDRLCAGNVGDLRTIFWDFL